LKSHYFAPIYGYISITKLAWSCYTWLYSDSLQTFY